MKLKNILLLFLLLAFISVLFYKKPPEAKAVETQAITPFNTGNHKLFYGPMPEFETQKNKC